MPAWDQLLGEFKQQQQAGNNAAQWLFGEIEKAAGKIAAQRKRNVMLYGSAFLQKPSVPGFMTMIQTEDVNGFMGAVYGMECEMGLDLVLHTPGGNPNAAEQIVAYLRSKFPVVNVIVPAMAMSAGTMISLASDEILMSRASQLGPIDTQFVMGNRSMSARGIVEQFNRATKEILENPAMAHVWAPITQSLGPALLEDAQNALDYSERMVGNWLAQWMFNGEDDAQAKGEKVAKHFNDATTHKSHGRRIDIAEVQDQGVKATLLEKDQDLQDSVLTLYHLMTIAFEATPMVKMIVTNTGRQWIKNMAHA